MKINAEKIIAGVDEAGRGPLAGPVVAAAVILDHEKPISYLKDSKKLTFKQRLSLSDEIKLKAKAWSIAAVEAAIIDEINILQATLKAMQLAVEQLSYLPSMVKIDGNQKPNLELPMETIVGGDDLVPEISAASILAKNYRDDFMIKSDAIYPGYSFAKHKGYGTKIHLEALRHLGPCSLHRFSFSPVKINS